MPDLSMALNAHKVLVAQIRLMFPAETEESLLDSIEGLTELDAAIFSVLRHAAEREAHGKAIAEMIDTLKARKRRLEEGARTIRLAALHAMLEAGFKKLAAPDMTVSVGSGKPKIVIVEEALIPDDLCRVTRASSKTDIARALAEGREIPGVTLGNPEPFIVVHRK